MATIAFPNYTQIPSKLSLRAWRGIRAVSLVFALVVAGLLIADPDTGLFLMWKVIIPALPLLFMVAPGVWRNICPLATSNQTPRALGITKALNPPNWLKEYGYVIAISLFVGFVILRKIGLDDNGPLSALLLLGAMTGAFAGGMVLKGKSGWCSTMCPLLPVQRIYGQTPFTLVANNHCQPCVGCAKNCYDFNPRAAYLADLNDNDGYWAGRRRFFVGAFPGLVLGFFATADNDVVGMLLYMAVSLALFALATTFVKVSTHTITSTFGAVAFGDLLLVRRRQPRARHVAAARRRDRARRRLARAHLAQGEAVPGAGRRADRRSPATAPPRARSPPTARSSPARPRSTSSPRTRSSPPRTASRLLEIAESNGMTIESGCRMGICGADPVAIKDGMECLSGISDDEKATLERLGLAPEHAHGVLRPRPRPGHGQPQARQGVGAQHQQGRGLRLRQERRQGRRDRQRDRGRDRRRPHPPPAPADQHRPDRRGAAPPLQPHGHRPPRLRQVRHAGPLPEPGHLVRRARDRDLAEHARAGDRPRRPRRSSSARASG